MTFAGPLETHFTFELPEQGKVESLCSLAASMGFKFTHIILSHGVSPSQPMLTRHGHGTLQSEKHSATQTALKFKQAGFHVSRIKIEASTRNLDVPKTDFDALREPCERYFEHHVKLLLTDQCNLRALDQIANRNAARLSRNAFQQHANGVFHRFVTQRCFHVGQQTAQKHLQQLSSDLAMNQYTILEIEEEYVIYDSNLPLDGGWMDA